MRRRLALLAAALVGSCPTALWAGGTCSVPGTHSLIQEAVDDVTCSEVVLLPQVYTEAILIQRTLEIRGPAGGGATVEGQIGAASSGTQLQLVDLAVATGSEQQGQPDA